ncbi:MAG: hypothetical protein MK193_13760 [Lentisphaeria bacterium]|nr:hypothetical protein [Lentisphaeria bacterium]
MQAVRSIAFLTIRACWRSRVAHILLFFIAFVMFVLPLTISGDGTAEGLLKISLTYSLGATGILLSIVALWLGTMNISEDIENHNLHMISVKPVSRLKIWFGKWLGINIFLLIILILAAISIYFTSMWRLGKANFPEEELAEVKFRVLSGRELLAPEKINLETLIDEEVQRRLRMGLPMPENLSEKMVRSTLGKQIERKKDSVEPGGIRRFEFKKLSLQPGTEISIRYRVYVSRVKELSQRATNGLWILYHKDEAGKEVPFYLRKQSLGGRDQEIIFNSDFIRTDGSIHLGYMNQDPEGKAVVFPENHGPFIMKDAVPFWNNYSRVIFLIFCQILFMATLGSICGSLASAPIALFCSFSYLIVGLLVNYVRPADENQFKFDSQNPIVQLMELVQMGTSVAIVSLNDFMQLSFLIRGELVDLSFMIMTVLKFVVLRGLPIVIIGLFFFNRRELGKVVRRA